jgi:hypothetical protein
MAEFSINGSSLGNELTQFLMCDELKAGDAPSYQMAKTIYEFHPLGAKLVEAPIRLAQSQQRILAIAKGPEERVKKAFTDEWDKINADTHIANLVRQARMYGIASLAMLVKDEDSAEPADFKDLWKAEIAFNVFDPLNTAGSLVLNQNPNSQDFLKTGGSVTVQGQVYHRSRVVVKMNEDPLFIAYTVSAFGFVGRSVYQRTLYPLKSFLQTMITDDMVARKAGIIVAKMKPAGSIVNQMMQMAAGVKRAILRDARTDNVISITPEEEITTIDLQNVEQAVSGSRKNILNNIAAGAGMPAILLNEETFAEGFGEGTEDAKHVALFVEEFRKEMKEAYRFFDRIVQYRAWNEEFYTTIQADFPEEYGKRTYEEAFYEWRDSFTSEWPSLLTEPDSDKSKADDVKLKAIIALIEVLMPECDPVNKATLIEWACDNFNALEMLFSSPLVLDAQALAEYEPPQPDAAPGEPKPFAAADALKSRLVALKERK